MQTYALLNRPRICKDDLSLFCFIPSPCHLAQQHWLLVPRFPHPWSFSSLCCKQRLAYVSKPSVGIHVNQVYLSLAKSSVFFTLFCSMHCSFRLVIDSKIDSSGYDWLWSRVLRICKKKLSRIKTEGMANVAIKAIQ